MKNRWQIQSQPWKIRLEEQKMKIELAKAHGDVDNLYEVYKRIRIGGLPGDSSRREPGL
jgi:hypothetical protein